jgi:hypothetical protein
MAARRAIMHDESSAETLLIRENILCIPVIKICRVEEGEERYSISCGRGR